MNKITCSDGGSIDNTVDDVEMSEILRHDSDLKKGLADARKGRYKIIG